MYGSKKYIVCKFSFVLTSSLTPFKYGWFNKPQICFPGSYISIFFFFHLKWTSHSSYHICASFPSFDNRNVNYKVTLSEMFLLWAVGQKRSIWGIYYVQWPHSFQVSSLSEDIFAIHIHSSKLVGYMSAVCTHTHTHTPELLTSSEDNRQQTGGSVHIIFALGLSPKLNEANKHLK